MNFFFFFNAIGQNVLSEEALESLEKRHYETLCFLEMYFPPSFFDISVHFTTHHLPFLQSRVLYMTSTGSLALTLTVKDISRSFSC
jgi:hypothetical protein